MVSRALQKNIGSLDSIKRYYQNVDCDFNSESSIIIKDKGDYVLKTSEDKLYSGNDHFFTSTDIFLKSSGVLIEKPFIVPEKKIIHLIETKIDDEILEMCRAFGDAEWNFRNNADEIVETMNFTIDNGKFALTWNSDDFCYCGEMCQKIITFTKKEIKPFITKELFDLLD